jgi:hypothetical protein
MKTLTFDAADVRRVVEHSIAAKTQLRPTRQAASNAPTADSVDGAVVPAVLLGCDHGVYLMSDGQPRDLIEGPRSFVAYAAGYDPFKDANWRAHARDLIGGDDFSLALPLARDLKALVDAGLRTISLSVDREGDRIEVEIRTDA